MGEASKPYWACDVGRRQTLFQVRASKSYNEPAKTEDGQVKSVFRTGILAIYALEDCLKLKANIALRNCTYLRSLASEGSLQYGEAPAIL